MDLRSTAGVLMMVFVVGCSVGAPSPSPSMTASPTPDATATATATPAPTPTASPTPSPTPTPSTMPTPGQSSDRLVARPLGEMPDAPSGFYEYLPPDYGDDVARPLLVFLHGSGQNGDGTADELERVLDTGVPWVIGRDTWSNGQPFVVLMPQHNSDQGLLCPDAAEVDEFLDFATSAYDIDTSRVYLTGVSCGAIGVWDYLAEHTDELVAAAVPIAGDGRDAFDTAGCDLGRVAIWAFHGGNDDQVDPEGSSVPIEALNECTDPAPVEARLNLYPGVGHAMWDPIYDMSFGLGVDIYEWLLGYSR